MLNLLPTMDAVTFPLLIFILTGLSDWPRVARSTSALLLKIMFANFFPVKDNG